MTTVTIRRRQVAELVAFEDQNFGGVGLGLADMPRNDDTNAATDGLLIAHDLLEHVNGARAIGTIEDELEALGAIWFVRGQFHELRRDNVGSAYTVHQNIASDVVRMFRDWFYGAHLDTKAPRTRPCDADADFLEVIACAERDMRRELDSDEDPREVVRRLREYRRVILPRMRIGYRKAARRFKGDAYAANRLFWEVAEAVGRVFKGGELFEGQRFELVYGIDDGRAFARCDESYGDEE